MPGTTGRDLMARVVAEPARWCVNTWPWPAPDLSRWRGASCPKDGNGDMVEYYVDAPGDDRETEGIAGVAHTLAGDHGMRGAPT